MMASRIAKASAIRGESTKPWELDPWRGRLNPLPEKIQARPACFNCLFHATISFACCFWFFDAPRFFVRSGRYLFTFGLKSCAVKPVIHSLANFSALVATSTGLDDLASKIKEFLATTGSNFSLKKNLNRCTETLNKTIVQLLQRGLTTNIQTCGKQQPETKVK